MSLSVVRRHQITATHVAVTTRLQADQPPVAVELLPLGSRPPQQYRGAGNDRHTGGDDAEHLPSGVIVHGLDRVTAHRYLRIRSHAVTLLGYPTATTSTSRKRGSLPQRAALRGEVVSFRGARREGGCGVVGLGGLCMSAEAAQQVGAGGVEGVVARQVQTLDELQGGPRPV